MPSMDQATLRNAIFRAAVVLFFTALASAATPIFKPAQVYPVGTSPIAAFVGDFNGDGKSDIAVANSGSSNVSILFGNGDGSFQAAANFDVGLAATGIAIGDVNADGKPDIIVTLAPNIDSLTAGGISILLGNGNGTFQAPMLTTLPVHESVAAVADLNGDKNADLLVNLTDSNFNAWRCRTPG